MPSEILSSLVNADRKNMRAAWHELTETIFIRSDENLTLIDLDLYLNKEKPADWRVWVYGRESFPLSLGLYEQNGRRQL